MSTTTTNKLQELIQSSHYLCDLSFNFNLEIQSLEEVQTNLLDLIDEQEVIYYQDAIKYLMEEDPSFQESFGLANDLGYSLDNLNSETLATIHYQDRLQEEASEIFNILKV